MTFDESDGKTKVRYIYEVISELDDFQTNMNFILAKSFEILRRFCQSGIGEGGVMKNYIL